MPFPQHLNIWLTKVYHQTTKRKLLLKNVYIWKPDFYDNTTSKKDVSDEIFNTDIGLSLPYLKCHHGKLNFFYNRWDFIV